MKKMKRKNLFGILPSIALGFGMIVGGTTAANNANTIQNSKLMNSTTSAVADSAASNSASTSATTGPQFTLEGEINKQYKAQSFYSENDMPVISNSNGPILLGDNGRSIAAYDWYGNPSWFLNLNSQNPTSSLDASIAKSDAEASYYKFSNASSSQIPWDKVGTKIVDIAYLPFKDFLYVLTDTSYIFLIESKTGVINSVKEFKAPSTNGKNSTGKIDKLAFIDFNNSLYGWNSKANDEGVYNIDTQKLTATKVIDQSSSGGSDLKSKYIFDILPLDVGYNVALYSDSQLSTWQASGSKTLKMLLIDDNGNKFSTSSQQVNSQSDNAVSSELTINLGSSITKLDDVYTEIHKRDNSNILVVGDKVYNIVLNKSAMNNTVVTNLTNGTLSTINTITKFNSSIIDEKGIVYLKDESQNIYQLSLNNSISTSMVIQTSNSIFDTNTAPKARIYPVLKEQNENISVSGTGYIASPHNFVCTGFTNGSILKQNFIDTTQSPQFDLNNYQNQAPSAIQLQSFRTQNTTSAALNASNTSMFSNDVTGELYVKTVLGKQSWYDRSLGSNTYSTVIAKWNCAKIEDVTKWTTQNSFNAINGGYFRKRSPDQISDADVTKYYNQILNLPSSVLSSDHKVDIIVVNRENNVNSTVGSSTQRQVGRITLKANVKYTNKQGVSVSYLMKEQKYEVKNESTSYKFKFYGGEENKENGDKVDISTLGSEFQSFKDTLPSLIKPTSDNLDPFIEIQDKYPTDTRRVITVTNANDTIGEITIQVHYNNLEATTPAKFSITYTGLATENSNKINFVGHEVTEEEKPTQNGKPVFESNTSIKDITTIPQYRDYNEKLATQITEDELNLTYSTNLEKMGFQPKLIIKKNSKGNLDSKDAEYGSITIQLDYRKSFSERLGINLPESYWDKFGLTKGVAEQRYIGFLPIGATYGLDLKSYDSKEVQDLVQGNNVNATIDPKLLLDTINIRGYNDEDTSSRSSSNVSVTSYSWDGEDLNFEVHAQSSIYDTVNETKKFKISWSPKFAAIRERNLIIASTTSVAGAGLVGGGIAAYILRRGRIRRLLK